MHQRPNVYQVRIRVSKFEGSNEEIMGKEQKEEVLW